MPSPAYELLEPRRVDQPTYVMLRVPYPAEHGLRLKRREDDGTPEGCEDLLLCIPPNGEARIAAASWVRALSAELMSIAEQLGRG